MAQELGTKRLIEVAFPLKQASLDSVHEKNIRHGHISTLHIWPARRPLAACRAALIATLLPDPGTSEKRKEILERLAGTVIEKPEKKKLPTGKIVERLKPETIGGILHWGRESNPDLEWFREEIRKTYGGRAPRVLDPFAGGGAIPLEAMRLGCEATAIDINPVAWFILKCTLEYPQKLAGQKLSLPDFVLEDKEFMEEFLKGNSALIAKGKKPTKKQHEMVFDALQSGKLKAPDADLAWHVRAWGRRVLNYARKDLARFYPTYADFEPLYRNGVTWEKRDSRIVPTKDDGSLDLESLNFEFNEAYLGNERNPRWVAKPIVAYLWARTVLCKNCRAVIPLLKTRWLCKKDRSRVLLTVEAKSDKTGVNFGVQSDVPVVGGNAAQRREYDKRISQGTMSRNGAWCPCCGKPDTVAMTMEDIRQEGLAGRLGVVPTAVVVDGTDSREYRLPTPHETQQAVNTATVLSALFDEIPFGLPTEPLPSKEALGFRVPLYGINQWYKLFTDRQLTALATFVKHTRAAKASLDAEGYDSLWTEAIVSALAVCIDRLADRNSCLAWWQTSAQKVGPTFTRWALPMTWDFCEICPWADASGGYAQAVDWVAEVYEHLAQPVFAHPVVDIKMMSATRPVGRDVDVIVTDPPYYDAIPYSDLMDFYYVWLRRTLHGLSTEMDAAFREQLSPKWDYAQNDGELIDDASRFGGDSDKSRQVYEDGMFRAFQACDRALTREGRLVIVFANKQPEAWETLVSAMIRAGFTVDGSWPIQTERVGRMRSVASAALSSSVWLVCKKRPEDVRAGWDNLVLDDMRQRISASLRDFWDAGIRGPDFVWAATGPALEAYSKHPVVKKANDAGKIMEVPEFLRHVRRLVVDFVVGRVLSHNGDMEAVSGLDDVTTYYLLHRHDFGMEEAPIGPCILYAISCGLSDRELADQYDILVRTGTSQNEEDEESDAESAEGEATAETAQGSGSRVKLKPWQQRQRRTLGLDGDSKPAPLVDQVHRLMQLWKAGNVAKVDDYLDSRGLRANHLFYHLLQALIELADHASEERSLLENISNHVAARGVAPQKSMKLAYDQVSTVPDEN